MSKSPPKVNLLNYQEMVSMDLWPVSHVKGEFCSLDDLLNRTEVGNGVGQIHIMEMGDIHFSRYFEYDESRVKRFVKVALHLSFFIGMAYADYVEELFKKINDAILAGSLKNYADMEGQIKLKPYELFAWMSTNPQYFVPSELIEAIKNKETEKAVCLLQAFRQAFIYRFVMKVAYKRRIKIDFAEQNMKWSDALRSFNNKSPGGSYRLPPKPGKPRALNTHFKSSLRKAALSQLNSNPSINFKDYWESYEVCKIRDDYGPQIPVTRKTVQNKWWTGFRKEAGISGKPGRPANKT